MHPDTRPGAVRLTVADLDREQAFYERVVGLRTLERPGKSLLRLGTDADAPLVELVGRPDAPRRPPGTTGLFHLALLVPGRRELGRAVRRVAGSGWGLSGASDHLVSEALYLRDPEGNGIEIYRDRPREQWRYADGELQMDTLPLDLDGLLRESAGADADQDGMPAPTCIGHVHLQVADLAAAEGFYHGLLGFDVTVRGYPGALFLSAGGYHHHLGVNTWAGAGAPPPARGSLGLRWFEVVVGTAHELERLGQRLAEAGAGAEPDADGLLVADPSGNVVRLKGPAPAPLPRGQPRTASA